MSLENGTFTILHVSDLHVTDGELLYDRVDGLARLEHLGEYAVAAGITPEAVVVTGDLVQRGHASAYPRLNAALRRMSTIVGAPVLTVLGNHDDVSAARTLSGHEFGHCRVELIGPLRLVLLDSSSGELDREQLAWLSAVLATPHGIGTVIALHHSPVPSPLPSLAEFGLRRAEEFAAVIAGSDVRLILAGHYHHPMFAEFHGVPVSVGPSLAYHQVMNAGPGTVSGHDRAMFSLVQVTPASVTSAPVGLAAPAPLFTTSVPPSPATTTP